MFRTLVKCPRKGVLCALASQYNVPQCLQSARRVELRIYYTITRLHIIYFPLHHEYIRSTNDESRGRGVFSGGNSISTFIRCNNKRYFRIALSSLVAQARLNIYSCNVIGMNGGEATMPPLFPRRFIR